MSYRPGIIKSAGLTNVVPLAGVEPAIPQGAYKSRAATNAFLRGEGSANIHYCLFNLRAAAVALAASERVHLATLTRSDSRFRLFLSQKSLYAAFCF